jgi:hypothetical protein
MFGLEFVLQHLSSTVYTISIITAWSLCSYAIFRIASYSFIQEFKVAVSSGILIDRDDTATSLEGLKEWGKALRYS